MLEGARLHRVLDPLTFSCEALIDDAELRQRATRQLRRQGLVILRQAVSAPQIAALGEVVHTAWRHAETGKAGDRRAPVLINRGDQRAVRGYRQLVSARKAVISVRANEDDGMLDVFHPERLDSVLGSRVVESLHEPLVQNLLDEAFGRPFHIQARNLYVNKGVVVTRGFHTDGGGMKAKAFLYLTDVDTLAQGPFCYVPGSHRRPWLRWLNLWYSRTRRLRRDDCGFLPRQQAVPVLCSAGDMVIAMQHGVHRGLPQEPAAERAVLLSMLQPKEPWGSA